MLRWHNVDMSNTGQDLDALWRCEITPAELLAACLNQADPDREQGWREYVAALAAEPTVADLDVSELLASLAVYDEERHCIGDLSSYDEANELAIRAQLERRPS